MKSRPDLLPPLALLEAGIVMSMNEEKHPNQRWKTMTSEEHIGAILRHILAWLSGNRFDPETGKSHLVHAMCRAAMAAEQEMCPPDMDGSIIIDFAPVSPINQLLAGVTDQNRHELIDADELTSKLISYELQVGDRVAREDQRGVITHTYAGGRAAGGSVCVKWDDNPFDEFVDKDDIRLVSRPEWEAYTDGKLTEEQCPVKRGKEIDAYTEKEWDEARL